MSDDLPHDPFIPSELDEAGLSANQFRVLCHLWRRGETYSTAATIAKTCRLKRDTVFESLSALQKAGFIRRISRPGQTTLITPVPFGGMGKRHNPSRTGGQGVSQTGGQDPSRLGGHKGNPMKGIPIRESRSLAEMVWQATPPKGRERSSKKHIAAALKKLPKDVSEETIIAALESWKRSDAWTKDGGQFIPGIHRWINDGKWETHPEAAKSKHAGIQEPGILLPV